MACDTKSGLLTELVYKVKWLYAEVQKLHKEDELLHKTDEELQTQIDEIKRLLELLTQDPEFGDKFSKLNDLINHLNDTFNINPELDADKYLYNDGENIFWKEVIIPEVDFSEIYEYINKLHPAKITINLTGDPKFGTYEVGRVIENPTITYTSSLPVIEGTITSGNKTWNLTEEKTKESFKYDGNISENTSFNLSIKGIDNTTGNVSTSTDKDGYTFVPFGYCIRIKTSEYIEKVGDVLDTISNWKKEGYEYVKSETGYSGFNSIEYTTGSSGDEYQYFYIAPATWGVKLKVQFTGPEDMKYLGSDNILNRYGEEVKYDVFTFKNLTKDDSISFTINR